MEQKKRKKTNNVKYTGGQKTFFLLFLVIELNFIVKCYFVK